MLPLFDMMTMAQNGAARDEMARRFGLSPAQVEEAMAALAPAFAQGLKRNTSDPGGLGAFLSALSSGQHAQYFEDMTRALQPSGIAEGNGILGHLFGSKELSRAVAAQAAQVTGIGEATLKQMLPALAAMVMGGLYKQTTGQLGGGAQANPLQSFFQQMADMAGAAGGQPARKATPDAMDNPFGRMMEGMFGRGAQGTQRSADPLPDNPFMKGMEAFFGGARPEPEPEPAKTPSGRTRTAYDELFGQMFEAGARQREDYQKSMDSIFDQYLKGMERR
jgi:hypothetical protein